MPLVLVAVAQPQIKDGCGAVAKFSGERRGEEIGIGEGLVVDDRHGAAARSWHREVVGVGKVNPFYAPQHAVGAVATHHDVVAAVVCALDTGKVAGHAGRVPARSCVAVRFFHRESTRTDCGHVVHDLPFLGGHDLRSLHGHDAFLKLHTEHHRAPACHDDAFEHPRLVPDEGHLKGVATQWHVVKGEPAVEVGHGHQVGDGQHLHGRSKERVPGFGVHNGSRNGGGLGHQQARKKCNRGPKQPCTPFKFGESHACKVGNPTSQVGFQLSTPGCAPLRLPLGKPPREGCQSRPRRAMWA